MMNDIRYVVISPKATDILVDFEFSTYKTHDEALLKINELMHECKQCQFDVDDIAENGSIRWKDGQEKEFIEHCAKIGEWWSTYAIYDLSNEHDKDEAEALGYKSSN